MSAQFHLAQRGLVGASEYSGSSIGGAPELNAYPDLQRWVRSSRDRLVALPNNIIAYVTSKLTKDLDTGSDHFDAIFVAWDERGASRKAPKDLIVVFPTSPGYIQTLRDMMNTGMFVPQTDAEKIAACARKGGKNCARALAQQREAAAAKAAGKSEAEKEAEYLRKVQKGKVASSGGQRDDSVATGQSGQGGGSGDSPDNVQYFLGKEEPTKPWWKNPYIWAGVGGVVLLTTVVLVATSGPKKVTPKVVYAPPAPAPTPSRAPTPAVGDFV